MASPLTIGELARAAGVPTSTVRFYEREGLLRPRGRSGANYRLYAEEDLRTLRFIRAARAIGFTLADVRVLLASAPCGDVQGLIEHRLAAVREQLGELRRVRRILEGALRACREDAESGRCRLVEDLTEQVAAAPVPPERSPAG